MPIFMAGIPLPFHEKWVEAGEDCRRGPDFPLSQHSKPGKLSIWARASDENRERPLECKRHREKLVWHHS